MNEAERADAVLNQMAEESEETVDPNTLATPSTTDGSGSPHRVEFSPDTTRAVSAEHVESDQVKSSRPKLKDWAKIVQLSSRFSEVSLEQLERVKLMHERFSEGAEFSFNYNTLLFVASILAGAGLVSNSSATIIASMLVSPIMGPVVGMAYGTTIMDWKLVKKSLKTEILSLVFCVAMGLLIAAITGKTELAHNWPTDEMRSRGDWINFLVGIPVAFISGLGVAVSLLDEQTSSLVGVAISASLLPPAVNAGIMWVAYWFVESGTLGVGSFQESVEDFWADVRSSNYTLVGENGAEGAELFGLSFARGIDEYLSKSDVNLQDYYRMGVLSLSLTLANIFLIYLSSMLMFRMKEVLPIKKKVFWEDLGVARKIYTRKAFFSDNSDDTT